MKGSFGRFKRRYMLEAVLKSAVAGISLALAVAGAMLLVYKLAPEPFHWAVIIAAGFAAFALAAGVTFLILRPTDVKVAKKLDKEHALGEKVQTMIAYSARKGDMVELQRQDTCERLDKLPAPKVKFSKIWQYVAATAVALALFVAAIFVPMATKADADGAGTGDDEPSVDARKPFEYDLYRQAAMAELRTDLMRFRGFAESGELRLCVDVIDGFIGVVDGLDAVLKEIEWEDEMKAVVIAAVKQADSVAAEANSFRAISAQISQFDENAGEAIVRAVLAYKSAGVELKEYDTVRKLVKASLHNLMLGVTEWRLAAAADALKAEDEGEMYTLLSAYGANMKAVAESEEIRGDEFLTACFEQLVTDINKTVTSITQGGYSLSKYFGDIDAAFSAFAPDLVGALGYQSGSCILNEFVRNRLAEIFGISVSEMPDSPYERYENDKPGTGDDDPGTGGNGSGGGGAGSGELIYGSDDEIYSPDEKDYVKYGTVLSKYKSILLELILRGDLPEETVEQLIRYYEILEGGL